MPEKKTIYEHKDLEPGLVTLMINGATVEQISVLNADSIDLVLSITEKTK